MNFLKKREKTWGFTEQVNKSSEEGWRQVLPQNGGGQCLPLCAPPEPQ